MDYLDKILILNFVLGMLQGAFTVMNASGIIPDSVRLIPAALMLVICFVSCIVILIQIHTDNKRWGKEND